MINLTTDYVQQHRSNIDALNPLARQILEMLFDETLRQLENGEQTNVNFSLEFNVSAYEPKDCLKVCVKAPSGARWCINQMEGDIYTEPLI